MQRQPEYQFLAFQLNALEELMRAIQNELRRESHVEVRSCPAPVSLCEREMVC